jgi:predicted HicB family RNase H-like nuclease
MAKKTFKDELNPALQFINTPNSTDEEEQSEQETMKQELVENIPISVPIKRNTFYIEAKSKRMQLLMRPSLHRKLKEMAYQKGTSLNDLIHTILEKSANKIK